jgi:DNA-binding protein HU-beta
MTKAQLIKELSKKTGIGKATVEATVESFMNIIKEEVANKQTVSLRGFGNFMLKRQAAKVARNIGKNEAMYLPERFIPKFKPSKQFSNKLKKLKAV